MQCTSCTAARSNGEVFLSSLYALFLVSTCNWMLETCWVCGVTCNGNVNAFLPHDSNTFTNVVCSVAVYFCTRSVIVCLTEYFFQLSCVVIVICLNICKSVDTRDDLCSVFSKTV